MVLSSCRITASLSEGAKNDGHPQWDGNLVSLRKISAPQARHSYTPVVVVSVYSPTPGRSVPALRSTAYSCGVSFSRHSWLGVYDGRGGLGGSAHASTLTLIRYSSMLITTSTAFHNV